MFSNPSKRKSLKTTQGGTAKKARKAGSDFSQQSKAKVRRNKKENSTPLGGLPRVHKSKAKVRKGKVTKHALSQTEPEPEPESSIRLRALPSTAPAQNPHSSPEPTPPVTRPRPEASGEDSTYEDRPEDEEAGTRTADTGALATASDDANKTVEVHKGMFSHIRRGFARVKSEKAWTTLSANLQNEAEVSPIEMGNRTMMGLLMDRELDITRSIIMNGDNRYDRKSGSARNIARQVRNILAWPATDLYRYLNDFPLDKFKVMGILPQESMDPKYEHILTEEPGEALDSQRIKMLGQMRVDSDDDLDASGVDQHDDESDGGYSGNPGISEDADTIADPLLNGGIGLVIRRNGYPNTSEGTCCDSNDDVQFLTKDQIMNPWLLAPRYSRILSQEDILNNTNSSNSAKQLVDLTRAQVIGQIQSHRAKNNKDSARADPLPLSKFASTAVAEEAVGGIFRTWSKINEMLASGVRSGETRVPFPGTAPTQWFSVLEAALEAGLPREVVARACYRLKNICGIASLDRSAIVSRNGYKNKETARRRYTDRTPDCLATTKSSSSSSSTSTTDEELSDVEK
ncbi:hypothetical protein IWW48_003070 [Coemansia sp. RSA 1200]|nr:hypothetical protein IWW48_003070 [Coemansia sp. RSA 1200]